MMNYQFKAFTRARAYSENLVPTVALTDKLLKKIVGIMGSDLIKGALD